MKSVPTDLSARVLTTSLPYFDRRLKGVVSVGLNFEKHKLFILGTKFVFFWSK